MPHRMVKAGARQLMAVLLMVGLFTTGVLAQDGGSCEAGFRPFTHALGESCIPENPQRVVVLDTGELDNALALGAPIVGAPVSDALQYQAYLSEQLEGIADTGTISEPNFEAILELAPDLIIGSKQRYEVIYPQLSEIAPTVFTESLRVPWQDNFRFHADALAKTAEAEGLLADYDAHVTELQAALGDALDTTTISIIRFRPGQVRLYLKSSYIGYILQDVGLARPESQDEDVFSAEISIEQMQMADADYIFVTGYDVEDSERETFLNSPLWQTLSAVEAGRVVDVNDDTWIAGLGVQAANLVLDDLVALLAAPAAEATESPEIAINCETGFRLFTHEYLWEGTPNGVCIPENPQRIAFPWYFHVPALLRMELPLVGISGHDYLIDEFPAWEAQIRAVPDVGDPANLEAILEVNPDLIIAPDWMIEEAGDQLTAIAPVVAFEFDGTHYWKSLAQLIFDASGHAADYDTLIAEYEARAQELAALIGSPQDIHLSLLNVRVGAMYIYTNYSPAGIILSDIGFARPEAQILSTTPEEVIAAGGWPYFQEVSMEEIQLADGDFVIVFGDFSAYVEDGEALQALQEHPLWGTLEAVQAGRVYISDQNWAAGDIANAHFVLDEIARAFGVYEQLSPNPYATAPEAEVTAEAG